MNKNKTFTLNNVLNAGDDYCLLIVANKKYRNKFKKIASINNTKISCIGKIVPTKGVHYDSSSNINNFKEFDHFPKT